MTTRSHTSNPRNAGFQQSAGSQQSANIFGINPESFQQNVDRANRVDPRLHNIPPSSIEGEISPSTLDFNPRVFDDEWEYNENVEKALVAEFEANTSEADDAMELSIWVEANTSEADDAMELSHWARIAAGDA